MRDFAEKTAVITGAASGIGRALADRCHQEGMRIVLADVQRKALLETANQLRAAGARVLPVPTDVSKPEDVERLAQVTLREFGAVHLLFNNAGVGVRRPLWEFSLHDWQWMLGVNLWGVIHGIRTFVPLMLEQDTECHIVNTASVLGLVTGPTHGAYKVTKHAIVALTETLYHELTHRGAKIGVSLLCPASVNTEITECERNRPTTLFASGPINEETQMELDFERFYLQAGMPPEVVADQVFQAIREERFYILTHPEWKAAIQSRMEDILQEQNPVPYQNPDVPLAT